MLGIGSLLTFGSYVNSETRGTYYVLWGPMLFGLWKITRAGWGLWEVSNGTVPQGFLPAVAEHRQKGADGTRRWPAGWPQPPTETTRAPTSRTGSVI